MNGHTTGSLQETQLIFQIVPRVARLNCRRDGAIFDRKPCSVKIAGIQSFRHQEVSPLNRHLIITNLPPTKRHLATSLSPPNDLLAAIFWWPGVVTSPGTELVGGEATSGGEVVGGEVTVPYIDCFVCNAGTFGYAGASAFVRKIYSTVKID